MTGNWFVDFIIILALFMAFAAILTFIHEMGHFAVAKMNKVHVAEFSIGFGPKIFSFGKNTKYSLRWVLFGGYVAPLSQDVKDTIKKIQMDENMSQEEFMYASKQLKQFDLSKNYENEKVVEKMNYFNKILFAMGGILFNFVALFVVFWITASTIGTPTATNTAYIPVDYAGSSTGSNQIKVTQIYVTPIDNVSIDSNGDGAIDQTFGITDSSGVNNIGEEQQFYNELHSYLINTSFNNNATIRFEITNNSTGTPTPNVAYFYYQNAQQLWRVEGSLAQPGEILTPLFQELENNQILWMDLNNDGILTDANETMSFNYAKEDFANWFTIQELGLFVSSNSFASTFEQIGYAFANSFLFLFTFGAVRVEQFDAHGYVNVADSNAMVIYYLMYLFMVFSILLIAFNILPIPPLDGYKASQWTYEKVKGKTVDPHVEAQINRVGWKIIMIYSILLLIIPFFVV